MFDALPVFADSLSRSFLVDEEVGSLLFFVVFFVHMLIPLAMGVALWLHITRLSRSRFLTRGPLTLWVLGALVVMSVALPADVAEPAHMNVVPRSFRLDGWYLLPIALTDRLGAGALWAVFLVAGVLVWTVPWTLVRRRARVAEVEISRCNACTLCYRDCPYDAIQMVPRTDGRSFAAQAQVDPQKCVGCGICAGSCDSAGIGLPWFDVVRKRARMDHFVDTTVAGGERPFVAFVCAESAGHGLDIDEADATCRALPGYRVLSVPCAGWVHALTVERALRHGAAGVLIVGCGPGSQMYREGGVWTRARLDGEREPSLREAKAGTTNVRFVELYRGDARGLTREAAAFRAGACASPRRAQGRATASGITMAVVFAAIALGGSQLGYALPASDASTLVVSFKHPGSVQQHCRDRSAEELQSLPPHMRQPRVCERRRAWVRLRAYADGARKVDKKYQPKGLWDDGNSLAIERIPMAPGRHQVRVELGDTDDDGEWNHVEERALDFEPGHLRVVTFDKVDGFRWR
jgi:coenzyme F420-reducing hydrogenase delta subunit/NAD-dependent dihydropyrimidine dehydrogenase PreA subunit